jgi:hypothetical protein
MGARAADPAQTSNTSSRTASRAADVMRLDVISSAVRTL